MASLTATPESAKARRDKAATKTKNLSRQDAKIFKFLIQTERQSKAAECFAAAQKIFSKLHIFFDIALQGPKNKSKEQGARPEPGSGSGAVSSFRTKE